MDSKIWVCGWLHPGLLVQKSGAELRRQDGAFRTDVPPADPRWDGGPHSLSHGKVLALLTAHS